MSANCNCTNTYLVINNPTLHAWRCKDCEQLIVYKKTEPNRPSPIRLSYGY